MHPSPGLWREERWSRSGSRGHAHEPGRAWHPPACMWEQTDLSLTPSDQGGMCWGLLALRVQSVHRAFGRGHRMKLLAMEGLPINRSRSSRKATNEREGKRMGLHHSAAAERSSKDCSQSCLSCHLAASLEKQDLQLTNRPSMLSASQ